MADEQPSDQEQIILHHPSQSSKYRELIRDSITEVESLLVEILKNGELVAEIPPIESLRQRRDADVDRLDPGVRRLMNPHIYHVSLSERLWEKKQELIASALSPIRT
jgi:nicotinate phosphoribosyltransferase